jgi:hypothetical protein
LDVSGCTALTELICWSNELTSLDVSKNVALTWLNCDDNQLTSLDVSKNVALITLDCGYNKLTEDALNALFGTLHGNTIPGGKTISIGSNPGYSTCDRSIATGKGWSFSYF